MSHEPENLDVTLEVQKENEDATHKKLIKGSLWMSAGNLVSRLLGAIYIIPWYAWMGDNAAVANSMMGKGYNIYAVFIMISTAGIPSAIAKQIAYYNSLNEYGISRKLFRRAMSFMTIMGGISAAVMFLFAPILAQGDQELVPVMRSLAVALLIIPVMSTLRGYFQGNHDMMPSAVSQIVEQVARVFYMLLSAFIIMKVMEGKYQEAVIHSTFAAFVGAVVGLVYMGWYYFKERKTFAILEAESSNVIEISTDQLLKEIIIEAVPFIVVGAGITLFKLIDQFTFERALSWFTNYTTDERASFFTLSSVNPDKLTMMVIAFATAIVTTGLPLITEKYTLKDHRGLAKLVSENLQLFFFIMLPASFGMMVVAKPLNTVFYGYSALGSGLLAQASIVAIVLGLFTMVSVILQGMDYHKEAMQYLVIGLLVKYIIQFPCIYFLESYAPLFTTMIGISVTCIMSLAKIHEVTKFSVKLTSRRILLILAISLFMTVVAFIVRFIFGLFLSPERFLTAFLLCVIVAVVGAAVYGYIVLKIRLADRLIDRRAAAIREKLKIK